MPKRVLIVDDTKDRQERLKKIISGLGHQVVGEAATGLDAVLRFQELNPDFVFLDLTMPVLDGMCALREIKALDPEALVCMVSAISEEEIVEEAKRIGAVGFRLKLLSRACRRIFYAF
jgi:two-component system chemotaxis response regulator CheY